MDRMESLGIVRDVSEDDYLELMTGESLKNLSELVGALGKMSDDVFEQHVSKHHNDFSDWILDAYGEEKLAKKIGKIKKKKKMRKVLGKLLSKEKDGMSQKIVLPKRKRDILKEIGEMHNEM